jgi:hypothetical protein
MKSLTESIIGRRGVNYTRIIPKLEKALDNNTELEKLAKKLMVSFEAMKEIFNKIKDVVKETRNMDINDRERAEWIDDFLENAPDELLGDENLDRIREGIGDDEGLLKDIIEDIGSWMFMQIK